jgi:hypothetical protein
VAGGTAATALQVPSDNGTLSIGVIAVAPSVSSLTSPQLLNPAFTPTGAADGVGHTQRLVLALTNPLSAAIHLAKSTLSRGDARRFVVQSDRCAGDRLAPRAQCRLSVLFTPTRAGTGWTVLELRGDGRPLSVVLHATAFARPAITRLDSTGASPCFARDSGNRVLVQTNERSLLTWSVRRQSHPLDRRCRGNGSSGAPNTSAGAFASGRTSAAGPGTLVRGARRYVARFALPADAGSRGLRPGTYRIIVTASNTHGTSRSKTVWVTVR